MDSKIPNKNFGGKLTDFKDNQERHFNQRMLKAYLNGSEYFHFGFHGVKLRNGAFVREPKSHKVLTTQKPISEKDLEKLLIKGNTVGGRVFGGMKQSKSQTRKAIETRLEIKRAAEAKKRETESPKKTLPQLMGLKK